MSNYRFAAVALFKSLHQRRSAVHKILLIEDDVNLAELIRIYLISEDWEIRVVHNGVDALSELAHSNYDLILLDLLLPDINGFDICRSIREKSTVPIIMLTALEDSIHKVQGLNMGADDYIIKPFEPTELIARINSQLRRSYIYDSEKSLETASEREVNKLKLSTKTHKAYYDNNEIELTPKEFDILWLLMGDPDKVYNTNEIHFEIWGDTVLESEVNPVMVHVRRIRGKFEKIGLKSIIQTVWGVGYKING